jgi:cellobiose epimerase
MESLKAEMHNELAAILEYWAANTVDAVNGGFIGAIDHKENKIYEAEKGAVMHARILWAFSAGYPVTRNEQHLDLAARAYEYIRTHFYDNEHGGVFWSINTDGSPKDTKNQIYAIAFAIYGLAEYHAVSGDYGALELAKGLYGIIETYSLDRKYGGYLEAFTRDWQPIGDLRLSDKDANEKKTMNTHLHIVEAYANLYRVWPDEVLKQAIAGLLETIDEHFINIETGHLRLFFNEEWVEKPDVISYGHDIEAAWLLLWCAETIADDGLIERYKKHAITMADATIQGLDADGGLWYEYDPQKNLLIAEKHWWPQAELLIGMANAWQLTRDNNYLDVVKANWQFVQEHILDKKNGEWIWGINADYSPIEKDKAGFWKCPYHNARACIELLHRL